MGLRWSLLALIVVGCNNYDQFVGGTDGSDDAPARDLAASPHDLLPPADDAAAADLSSPPPDLAEVADLSTIAKLDLASANDLSLAPMTDFATPPDLATRSDLATSGDLASPGDLATQTDLALAACMGGACVPTAPNGWSGPFELYEGMGPAPACGNAFVANPVYSGQNGFGAAPANCSCACGAPTGITCSDVMLTAYNTNACNTNPCASASIPNNNMCAAVNL